MSTLRQVSSFILLIFSLAVSAQTSQTNLKVPGSKITVPFRQKDTSYWVDNFRQFRDAIFQRDKTKAKVFFDFPIIDSSNEIWYLAYDKNEKAVELLHDAIKPFTETDFDKYFDKLFSKTFVKSLLKIKTDELFKKGAYQTPEFKDHFASYILYSTYDKTENTLDLNFTSGKYRDEKGEPLDGESNIFYLFQLTKKGHIKFIQIRLAG
jgi:hypothetical protein